MLNERVRTLTTFEGKKGPILYWMSRDQRINDNWAFLHAQNIAIKRKQPLIILFCLNPSFLGAHQRNFKFMLEGLKLIEKELGHKKISFVVLEGKPTDIIPKFIKDYGLDTIITDFSPLNLKKGWINGIKKSANISIQEVDSHNIIPCWIVSNKQEYAAYTLRPKVKKSLKKYLDDYPKNQIQAQKMNEFEHKNEFSKFLSKYNNYSKEYEIKGIKPGEKEALKTLENFIATKLKNYNTNRNDPSLDGTSNLSPYLHFGHISSQRVVLEVSKKVKITTLKNSFYDEIIVRKELSDNFCFYAPRYNEVKCFPSWAQKTLETHRNDSRDYIYSLEEFEKGNTHDEIWNAAQNQMVFTGKMHGYMRMYWGKKILEWTKSPEEALKIATNLNDRYEIDGRDPNGYVGIAWSIGGVHDRAWKERNIFGKIRYMSAKGLKRKFNMDPYVNKYSVMR